MELRIHRAELLPLRTRQPLPRLHVLQHPLLPVRRQAIEVLQSLLELLLPLWRQAAEIRIALERSSLLINGHLAMLFQPLPGTSALVWLLVRTWNIVSFLNWV